MRRWKSKRQLRREVAEARTQTRKVQAKYERALREVRRFIVVEPSTAELPRLRDIADADMVIDARTLHPVIIKNRWGCETGESPDILRIR